MDALPPCPTFNPCPTSDGAAWVPRAAAGSWQLGGSATPVRRPPAADFSPFFSYAKGAFCHLGCKLWRSHWGDCGSRFNWSGKASAALQSVKRADGQRSTPPGLICDSLESKVLGRVLAIGFPAHLLVEWWMLRLESPSGVVRSLLQRTSVRSAVAAESDVFRGPELAGVTEVGVC